MMTAIETAGLTKRYGERRGVFDLDLTVAEGEIFGFLGPNGAGKTTTIRILMDLVRADAGRAAVFGQDSRRDAVAVHRLTGYLPGELALDPKLSGHQLLTYLGNLRGGVDQRFVEEMSRRLELNLDVPFGKYSRGNKQKVGLVQAFMHRPKLLILDEPTSGLDPLNQETVLELVREAQSAGATVFFSSHMLSEVEAVCGRVAFIREGRLAEVAALHDLPGMHLLTVEAECAQPPVPAAFEALASVSNLRIDGTTVQCLVRGDMQELLQVLTRFSVRRLLSREPSLNEAFLHLYGGENNLRASA